jgi:hypothetical protein
LSSSSQYTARSITGVALSPAEQKDLYPGNAIFIRGRPATVTHFEFPHVYWRTEGMAAEEEKHRSFTATPAIFSVDVTKRGSIPVGGTAGSIPAGPAREAAAGLTAVGGGLRVGAGEEDEDDDYDDDDDDDAFTAQQVAAVLKPKQARSALAHIAAHSPKNSPKHRAAAAAAAALAHDDDAAAAARGAGAPAEQEGLQGSAEGLADSDS